jgi:hypothetical protein
MNIIKRKNNGTIKIGYQNGVIFVKPFEDGDQNYSSGWMVDDNQNDLSKEDATQAFELATGINNYLINIDNAGWVVRVK